MDASARKKIIDDACAFTLDVFRKRALNGDESFSFERVFDSMENFFCEEIFDAAEKEGLSEQDRYKLYFSGWEERKKNLREQCHALLMKIQKERAVEKIIAVTVESLVEPRIREIGLPYRLSFQKYRLKVSLRIAHRQKFEFYIRYRDMNKKEITDYIPERTRGVIEYIKMFGPQVRLRGNCSELDWRYPEGYNRII